MSATRQAELWTRRDFCRTSTIVGAALAAPDLLAGPHAPASRPESPLNIVFVFADQWRADATGYAGDPNVKTPHLDELADRAASFTTAVANCPVCSPYRASLLTGQYPLTHGVFLNDVHLADDAVTIARLLKAAGYDTGYIGKWHLDGRGRLNFIPRASRQGFDFWRACECTHDYNKSVYYGDENVKRTWDGYDAQAQTRVACDYIRGKGRDPNRPFLLMLSWGPPHNPYETAPARFRALYEPAKLKLRPNVPAGKEASARKDLAGYYAHCSALDGCIGDLLKAIREAGIEDRTIFAFTSDHGDMLGSQGQQRKQRPWDESIRVPFLLACPAIFGRQGRKVALPFNCPDILPTLLGLCGLAIPEGIEGIDFSGELTGRSKVQVEGTLIACYWPFGEFTRAGGGREYRGVRTERYTYVRDLNGPWLLYDNQADPYQQANLVNRPEHVELQGRMDGLLARLLKARKDEFLPGGEYVKKWRYRVNQAGEAPTWDFPPPGLIEPWRMA